MPRAIVGRRGGDGIGERDVWSAIVFAVEKRIGGMMGAE